MSDNILNVTFDAFQKMLIYTQLAQDKHESEVLGFLVIEEGKKGLGLTVVDVILPEQDATQGECKLNVGETLTSIPQDLVPKIKGWWHSHQKMGCFYSQTDNETLENWCYKKHYAVGVVVSLPYNIKAYIQHGKPLMTEKQEIDVKILFNKNKTLHEQLEKEITKKIKTPKTETTKTEYEEDKELMPYLFPFGTGYPYSRIPNPEVKVVKPVEEIIRETQPEYFKPVHLNELPKGTVLGCGYLDMTDKTDIFCVYYGYPPIGDYSCESCLMNPKNTKLTKHKHKKHKKNKRIHVNKHKPIIKTSCNELCVLADNQLLRFTSDVRNMIKTKTFKNWKFICGLGFNMTEQNVLNCRNCHGFTDSLT